MPFISKLLGMWVLGKTVSHTTPLFMRLLLGMIAITVFIVFAALLVAILAAGVIWFTYSQLLVHGMTPGYALLVIAAILIALLIAALLLLQHNWRAVNIISRSIDHIQSPVVTRASGITRSFLKGFDSPSPLK